MHKKPIKLSNDDDEENKTNAVLAEGGKSIKRKLTRSESADSFLAKRCCLHKCVKFAKAEDSEEHSAIDNEPEDPGLLDPAEEDIDSQSSDEADDDESPASVANNSPLYSATASGDHEDDSSEICSPPRGDHNQECSCNNDAGETSSEGEDPDNEADNLEYINDNEPNNDTSYEDHDEPSATDSDYDD